MNDEERSEEHEPTRSVRSFARRFADSFFSGKIEDKEYTEADYQQLKKNLEDYFDNYVRNVEN